MSTNTIVLDFRSDKVAEHVERLKRVVEQTNSSVEDVYCGMLACILQDCSALPDEVRVAIIRTMSRAYLQLHALTVDVRIH